MLLSISPCRCINIGFKYSGVGDTCIHNYCIMLLIQTFSHYVMNLFSLVANIDFMCILSIADSPFFTTPVVNICIKYLFLYLHFQIYVFINQRCFLQITYFLVCFCFFFIEQSTCLH